jgi:hypothetical protein
MVLAVVVWQAAAFAQQASPPPPTLTPSQPAPPVTGSMSLPNTLSVVMQQVSALQQAEIDQQIAAEGGVDRETCGSSAGGACM